MVSVIHFPDHAVEIIGEPFGRERREYEALTLHGFAIRVAVRLVLAQPRAELPTEFLVQAGRVRQQDGQSPVEREASTTGAARQYT